MPHVRVKMYKGHSEEAKRKLAQRIAEQVTQILGGADASVSVAIEDVEPADWKTQVYEADILANSALLYKKPGYKM